MSRIETIIENVRDTLGDDTPNSYRWTDAKLVRFLNSGIREIIATTHCLKERLYVALEDNVAIYNLSEFALQFLRVQYIDKVIEAKTSGQLTRLNVNWESAEGTEVQYVNFDNLPEGHLRIYPRVTGALGNITANQTYGGLIDVTINDELLQIPGFENLEESISKYLIVDIVKKPTPVTISTLDTDFEINSAYDYALEYFITAKALRADTDTLSRAFGSEQLQLFAQALAPSKANLMLSNNIIPTREVKYQGAF